MQNSRVPLGRSHFIEDSLIEHGLGRYCAISNPSFLQNLHSRLTLSLEDDLFRMRYPGVNLFSQFEQRFFSEVLKKKQIIKGSLIGFFVEFRFEFGWKGSHKLLIIFELELFLYLVCVLDIMTDFSLQIL